MSLKRGKRALTGDNRTNARRAQGDGRRRYPDGGDVRSGRASNFRLSEVVFVLSRVRQDAFSCVRYVAPRRGGELVAICFRRAREIAKMLDGTGTLLPHVVR